jgi:hypothetical protein
MCIPKLLSVELVLMVDVGNQIHIPIAGKAGKRTKGQPKGAATTLSTTTGHPKQALGPAWVRRSHISQMPDVTVGTAPRGRPTGRSGGNALVKARRAGEGLQFE